MTDYTELRALRDGIEFYDDGTAIHTSGDETCVDDCAACKYEAAAGAVLPGLLAELEVAKGDLDAGRTSRWTRRHFAQNAEENRDDYKPV